MKIRIKSLLFILVCIFVVTQLCRELGNNELKILPERTGEGDDAIQFGMDSVSFRNLSEFIKQENPKQFHLDLRRDGLQLECSFCLDKGRIADSPVVILRTNTPEHELFPPSIRRMIDILQKAGILQSALNREDNQQISMLNTRPDNAQLEWVFNQLKEYWEFPSWGID